MKAVAGKFICKRILRGLALLIGGSLAGIAALWLVFLLPMGRMQRNVSQSLPMLQTEFADGDAIAGFPASMKGSFTDDLMLGNAVYDGGSHTVTERAVQIYRAESGQGSGWATGYSLCDYLGGDEAAPCREVSYARYWHGYLIVLKPLLMVTTVNGIRMFAALSQLILVLAVGYMCVARGEKRLAAALGLSIPFLYFFMLYYSLSLSICFYLMAGLLLVQLKFHEKMLAKDIYWEFFLLAGMMTAYFDFLTYPLVVLCFPLVLYWYLREEEWKRKLGAVIGFGLEWSVGYLAFWALKWFWADALTVGGIWSDAAGTLAERTEKVSGVTFWQGYGMVLQKNLEAYENLAYGFLLVLLGIWCIVCVLRAGKHFWNRESLLNRAIVLLIALAPFGWYLVTQNHSYEHATFTYRILAITVFAGVCACVKETENPRRQGIDMKNVETCEKWEG